MNDAHLHLVVNHFPIIGIIFGLGILITGIFIKNNTVKNTAYFIFIVAAMFAFAAMYTGEGAEEIVEDMPTIGHQVIHEHEELAEKFAILAYILGIFSIIGFYLNLKSQLKARLFSFVILTTAIIATILSSQVGTSGGEIRHTEIRANANTMVKGSKKQSEEHED